MDFPGGSVVKNPPASAGDTDSVPDPGRYPHTLEQLSRVPQLLGLCSRMAAAEAQALQSPCSTTGGATATRSLHTAAGESPHSLQLGKSLHSLHITANKQRKLFLKIKK